MNADLNKQFNMENTGILINPVDMSDHKLD